MNFSQQMLIHVCIAVLSLVFATLIGYAALHNHNEPFLAAFQWIAAGSNLFTCGMNIYAIRRTYVAAREKMIKDLTAG